MFYEPDKNDHGLPRNPLKSCVVRRPIGWISTLADNGRVNLAPFSPFNLRSYLRTLAIPIPRIQKAQPRCLG